MSIWAKTWAYEQHPRRVDDDKVTDKKHPGAKSVLVALAEYPGVGQRVCWPSQKTLAGMTDLTERQVRRCMSDLEVQGLIKRTQRRREDGTRRSDRVTLCGPVEAFGPPQDDEELPDDSSGSQADERAHQPDDSSGHEPSAEPSVVLSGVQQAETPRIDLVKVLVDDLDTLDVYLSDDEKKKYAGQIGQLRRKEVSDKRIIRGLKRLVADWDRYPHTSVQKALSFAEGNTNHELDKPTQALAGSPPELIESLRNVAELKRYAPLAQRFDFTRLEKDQQPDWPIFSQLGGDDSERYRNLQRIVSRAAKATCSA